MYSFFWINSYLRLLSSMKWRCSFFFLIISSKYKWFSFLQNLWTILVVTFFCNMGLSYFLYELLNISIYKLWNENIIFVIISRVFFLETADFSLISWWCDFVCIWSSPLLNEIDALCKCCNFGLETSYSLPTSLSAQIKFYLP